MLTSFTLLWQVILALAVFIHNFLILPILASVIGISFAIVVYHEVVLVQSASHHLLVSLIVDGLVYRLGFLHFVCIEASLARSPQSADLGETVGARNRHDGDAVVYVTMLEEMQLIDKTHA